MKLGKLAPKDNPRTLLFDNYVKVAPLPPEPTKAYWEYRLKVPWQMFKNDTVGDCTCAGPAHEILNRTIHKGSLVTPTDSQVIAMYSWLSGYDPMTGLNDNGAAITDALDYLRTTGLAGEKIDGWAQIDN